MRPTTRARGLDASGGRGACCRRAARHRGGVAERGCGRSSRTPSGPTRLIVTNFTTYPAIVPPAGCIAGAGFVDGPRLRCGSAGQAGLAAGAQNVHRTQPTLRETGLDRPPVSRRQGHRALDGIQRRRAATPKSIGVSLALKESQLPDVRSAGSSSCCSETSPTAARRSIARCSAGRPRHRAPRRRTRLTLTMPTGNVACFYQVDLVIGGPLSEVGPNGSYYNDQTRVDERQGKRARTC